MPARKPDSTRGIPLTTSAPNGMVDWIETDRASARGQLAGEVPSLRFQPVRQVLQKYPHVDALGQRFEAFVEVEPPAEVHMLVRMGRTATPGVSPRRPIGDFIDQDKTAERA